MRKFIFKVLLFLVVITMVDRVFGIAMENILDETNKGDWGRNNFIFNEVRSDVIILGSSRAIHHYDPQIISDSLGMSCYNCGEDGMGIFLMWTRYQAIRERSIPKLVIYEVLPEYDLLSNSDNQKYLKFLRPFCDKPFVKSIINEISSKESMKLQSYMYMYNSVFADIIAQRVSNSPSTAREYTYSPLVTHMNYNPKKNMEQEQLISCDSLKIACLKKLILLCKKDGTQLFFTASPKYTAFSDDEFLPIKDLCRIYNVPFINHYCDMDYCKNPTYFADAGHLNFRGAELLTTLVVSEIKESIQKHKNSKL